MASVNGLARARGVFGWKSCRSLSPPLAAGAVALTAQQRAGALVSTESSRSGGRIAQSLYGVTFYLVKTLLPTDLAPLYEIPVDFYLFNSRVILAGAMFFSY